MMPGPDFPTGGILVEPRRQHRRSLCHRPRQLPPARALGQGAARRTALYQIVVTEIPYQVPKSRLIEKIAALLEEKKLPLLADVRDELAEDIRLVLRTENAQRRPRRADGAAVPAHRAGSARPAQPQRPRPGRRAAGDEPEGGAAGVPRPSPRSCCSGAAGTGWRRSARRMEVLRGLIIVYVNLDEVIRIIREEDEPKAEMMARWGLSDVQAEAILNMRLRALRRLEEVAIRKELEALGAEAADSRGCSPATRRQWTRARQGSRCDAEANSAATPRSAAAAPTIGEAPEPVDIPVDGADRARAGHHPVLGKGLDPHRQGPQRRRRRAALQGRRRAALRGAGRDHRPAGDLWQQRPVLHARRRPAAVRARPGRAAAADDRPAERARDRRDVPLSAGHEDAGRGERRARLRRRRRGGAGADPRRQAGACRRARARRPASAFRPMATPSPLSARTGGCWSSSSAEIPEIARGRGVILQRYRMGKLADAKVFRLADGLSWRQSESRTRTETDLTAWRGPRGSAGRIVAAGLPEEWEVRLASQRRFQP